MKRLRPSKTIDNAPDWIIAPDRGSRISHAEVDTRIALDTWSRITELGPLRARHLTKGVPKPSAAGGITSDP